MPFNPLDKPLEAILPNPFFKSPPEPSRGGRELIARTFISRKDENLSAFELLPPEVLLKIFSYLSPQDIENLRRTSSGFYDVADSFYKNVAEKLLIDICMEGYLQLAPRGLFYSKYTYAFMCELGVERCKNPRDIPAAYFSQAKDSMTWKECYYWLLLKKTLIFDFLYKLEAFFDAAKTQNITLYAESAPSNPAPECIGYSMYKKYREHLSVAQQPDNFCRFAAYQQSASAICDEYQRSGILAFTVIANKKLIAFYFALARAQRTDLRSLRALVASFNTVYQQVLLPEMPDHFQAPQWPSFVR